MSKALSKLKGISRGAEKTIFRADAVFPFDLFPNSIIVDKNKIDIIYRNFLWSKEVFTVLISDLTTIKISAGPLFARVWFEVRGYERNPDPVDFIKKNEAIRLKNIVVGLTKATQENIELNKITKSRIEEIEEIGKSQDNLHSAL